MMFARLRYALATGMDRLVGALTDTVSIRTEGVVAWTGRVLSVEECASRGLYPIRSTTGRIVGWSDCPQKTGLVGPGSGGRADVELDGSESVDESPGSDGGDELGGGGTYVH